MLHRHGKLDEALILYDEVLRVLVAKLGSGHLLVASIQNK